MRATVFLDRDGTINVDRGFVHRPEDLEFIPGAVAGLAALKRAGFLLIVVTNQSGVARGYYSEVDVERFHVHMNRVLAASDATIDAFYYCPYLHDAPLDMYRRESVLRKPNIGMFQAACRDFAIDPAESYMVGDRVSDMEFATRAGIRPILVKTGRGAQQKHVVDPRQVLVLDDLAQAAATITRH